MEKTFSLILSRTILELLEELAKREKDSCKYRSLASCFLPSHLIELIRPLMNN